MISPPLYPAQGCATLFNQKPLDKKTKGIYTKQILRQHRQHIMAITSNNHHNTCPVIAVRVEDKNCKHYAKLCCKKHNKMIQWLNKADYETIVQMYPDTIGQDGVKQRPTRRRKPEDRELIFQQKDGHLWRTVY